jgi:fibronectin type III domain protein/concanavalin A-like lectin/glucanase superfamily protein
MPIVKYKTMKNIYIIISFLFLAGSLFALDSNISIGGAAGWEQIDTWNNVEVIDGKKGYTSIGLKSAIYKPDELTDLLIHFDNSEIVDSSGNYLLVSQIENTKIKKSIGNSSGVFRGSEESIILYPGPAAIFSGNDVLDNFSIEFWLNPSRFSKNPILISYQGTLIDQQGNIVPQELNCSIENRKLVWKLNNIFFTEEKNTNIKLKGLISVIPEKWHHHQLRFNGSSGIIEYLVDGKLEAIQYASKTGTEDGTILYPLISSSGKNPLIIGKGFTGYMDELRISKDFIQDPVLRRYQETSGSAVSQIIDFGRSNSILKKIAIDHEIPQDSAIFYQYNISDNLEAMFDESKWIEFQPPKMFLSQNKGRYFRVRMDMKTDGEESMTPSLSQLDLIYERNLQPLAPSYLHGTGKESSITLSWPEFSETDIEGYLIYYGTQKGIYFGSDAMEGTSPLTVQGKEITNITLHGLETGQLYHFSIAAYDEAGPEYPGLLSKEITVRPMSSGNN